MERRLTVLQSHLAPLSTNNSVDIFKNPTSAAGLDSQELYQWLVRDNRELREAIFEFLKARIWQKFSAELVST